MELDTETALLLVRHIIRPIPSLQVGLGLLTGLLSLCLTFPQREKPSSLPEPWRIQIQEAPQPWSGPSRVSITLAGISIISVEHWKGGHPSAWREVRKMLRGAC